jgi:hypothetical protein
MKTAIGIAIGIVLGVTAALLIKGKPVPAPQTDPCLVPGPHTIQVGSNGSLSCPTAIMLYGDRITWQSPVGTRLTIRLQATNLGQPSCPSSNICTYTAPASGTSNQMSDYDVTVTGGSPNPSQTNGRIIIQR